MEKDDDFKRVDAALTKPKAKDSPTLALIAINICSISFVVTSVLFKKAQISGVQVIDY